ncbi:ABC transporter permease [Castellaniella defragrans]|uniref:Spermidine Putrescine ABC transporter permease component PotB n=1 Tax=Castellaniella defragrans (strain DSM 12143 / CCUG 39792 / 65Phen) TaxID=1437824 RepID=W8WZM5_CASD6|nr:ABC transporter permease [Castellaniella defragrans]CDM25064.1 Spermidine Putrescine ABC transporter permease component PotB [Castellaniella defragrans 65Phen]
MDTTLDDPGAIRRAMQAAQRRRTWRALLLVGPLALFLLAIFVIPIAALLTRAADNPEVIDTLPHTLQALTRWDGRSQPPDAAFAALAQDLAHAKNSPAAGELARRLNYEISGYRSLIFKTLRRMPLDAADAADARAQLTTLDKRWADPAYWAVIASNDRAWTPYYLLASLDLKLDADGRIVAAPPDTSAFQEIFSRTFVISLVVTLVTLALGYPLAYWITRLPKRQANLVLICILIPFWTSVLVRIAAWVVLLQREGLINGALGSLGLIAEPLPLLFNRLGVYIAMVHILLPFMVLPLYSVMQSVPPTYQRAAVSLGSHPFAAFWRVYVPQTYPGVAAGSLLVFIIAIGYYITPALLGGAGDQMISYYVAYFTNQTINWGMASALGLILLAATLLLYTLYRRISGKELALN